MSETNLDELSLVIPTYGRQDIVLRQMLFWSGSPVTLHVLDGTSTPIKKEELRDVGGNIHYHHLPFSYEERVGYAGGLIDTPYTAFLSDDEYFLPRALEDCVTALKNDHSLVACMGLCMRFHTIKGIVYGSSFNNVTLDGSNIPVYYAVQPSDVWKKNARIVSRHKYSCAWVQEFQFETATHSQGETKVINELMWLRNTKNKAVETKGWSRKLGFNEWLNNPRYEEEVRIFLYNTAEDIHKINGGEELSGYNELLSSIDKTVKWYKENNLLFKTASIRNILMNTPPKQFKELMDSIRIQLTWMSMMKAAEKMNVEKKQLQEIIDYETR